MLYFYNEINQNPTNNQYKQAEYYRLNNLYNIGRHGRQIPFCLVLTSSNNEKSIRKTYESIKNQNYSNYKIIHIEDNSKDRTLEESVNYLMENRGIRGKTTIVKMPAKRNRLFNTHMAITNYCADDDIIA